MTIRCDTCGVLEPLDPLLPLTAAAVCAIIASMDRNALKRRAAEAALAFVEGDSVIGVGTGSTAAIFIDLLQGVHLRGAVASSRASEARLRAIGVPVLDLNSTGSLPLYVDGADQADYQRRLLKGGGAALTREKICAAAADRFVCIVDESKLVTQIGSFPLAVEVIPMARALVTRELAALGGEPVWREGTVTDNGNEILDILGLDFRDPIALERAVNDIAGVVACGLFAMRKADVLLVAHEDRIEQL